MAKDAPKMRGNRSRNKSNVILRDTPETTSMPAL